LLTILRQVALVEIFDLGDQWLEGLSVLFLDIRLAAFAHLIQDVLKSFEDHDALAVLRHLPVNHDRWIERPSLLFFELFRAYATDFSIDPVQNGVVFFFDKCFAEACASSKSSL
jgi:hypothetical protein